MANQSKWLWELLFHGGSIPPYSIDCLRMVKKLGEIIMKIYIKEGDWEGCGNTSDISEHIGTENTIICTYGGTNVFYINGDVNKHDMSVENVRKIKFGKEFVRFTVLRSGNIEDATTFSVNNKMVKTVKCGGHFGHHNKDVDMSQV